MPSSSSAAARRRNGRRPRLLLAGLLAAGIAVGLAREVIQARNALPPPDRSRPVLASQYADTELLHTLPSGEAVSKHYQIGPITTWKDGIVYWDDAKRHLVHLLPGGKQRRIVPKPAVPDMMVFSLIPGPDAVYLNLCGMSDPRVAKVRLADGFMRLLPGAEHVSASDRADTFAYQTPLNDVVIVRGNTRRTVSLGDMNSAWSWDYDSARDAVVVLGNRSIRLVSPARSWHVPCRWLTEYSSIQFAENGDVWVQASGPLWGQGTYVISADGRPRGWRMTREIPSSFAQRFTELSPEQERLLRTLPEWTPY